MRERLTQWILAAILAVLASAAVPAPLRGGVPQKLDRSDLRIGSYAGQVHQVATAKTDGTTVEDDLPFRLTILRIEADGTVQARVVIQRHSGDIAGSIDAQNRLHLEGTLTHSALPGTWVFKLDALAKDDKLVEGTYTKVSDKIASRGTFRKATLER